MKLETFKSILLFVLVGISLLLTFSLWNDSPRYAKLNNSKYISEADVGGDVMKKKDLIDPNQIIFHDGDRVQGFGNPKYEKELYIDLSLWELEDFRTGEAEWNRKKQREIEIIYPAPVPMRLLTSLFTMESDVFLPAWSYKRIFLTFDQASTTMQVKFISSDGAYEATATLNDAAQYKKLSGYFTNGNHLVDYLAFKNGTKPIYIPAEAQTVNRRSIGAQTIDEKKFVKALFKKQSMVSENKGESYYLDGQRGMRVMQNKRSIEYVNLIESDKVAMDSADLIDKSIENINEHKGWTADFDYNLFKIDTNNNSVSYKMYYKGYEIFNSNGLATIEQQWRKGELYKYRRPLFYLNSSLGSDPVTLPSGKEIVKALKENSDYEQSEIQDIRIGYFLDYPETDTHSIILEPLWFMNYKGNWQPIEISNLQNKGSDI